MLRKTSGLGPETLMSKTSVPLKQAFNHQTDMH